MARLCTLGYRSSERKKGRDLFDLSIVLKKFPELNILEMIKCFNHYMEFTSQKISRAEFEANLAEKLSDAAFLNDISALLPNTTKSSYDPLEEIKHVQEKIICKLHGNSWKNQLLSAQV